MTVTSTSINDLLTRPDDVADIITGVARAEIIPRFQHLATSEIREKKAGDLVTAADEASEIALRSALMPMLDGCGFLGEEAAETHPELMMQLSGSAPIWIVDPVDGTHNYAHGRTPFAVIVALCIDGVTRAGWIHDPATTDTVWAIEGKGAWHRSATGEKSRCQTQNVPLEKALMPAGERLRRRLERAKDSTGTPLPNLVERYRCTGREYMDVALGKLNVARYGGRLKPWDHAAGCLIVREAGGRADTIATELPYQPTEEISAAPVGVVAHDDLWPAFRDLAIESDKARA